MSYCINCGVELAKSEKKCPLCGIPVTNPAIANDRGAEKLYPEFVEPEKKVPYISVFGVIIYSMILALPFFLTLFIDYQINKAITWSLYPMASILLFWTYSALPFLIKNDWMKKSKAVKLITIDTIATIIFLFLIDIHSGGGMWSLYAISSIILLWIFVVLPIFIKKPREIKAIIVDGVALSLYLWSIERLTNSSPWFFSLALPLVSLVTLVILLNIALCRSLNLKGLAIPGMIFLAIGYSGLGINLIVNNFLNIAGLQSWSIIELIACILVAGILFYIYSNKKLQIFLKKKLHV